MTRHLSHRSLQVLAGIGALSGPIAAMLYETGHLQSLPGDVSYKVWLLVILAALDAGIGLVCFSKGARIAGAVCLLSSLAVLLLYGSIALFFAFGGSR